jgi:hypothetical protein
MVGYLLAFLYCGGWQIDRITPDRFDLLGSLIAASWRPCDYVLARELNDEAASR